MNKKINIDLKNWTWWEYAKAVVVLIILAYVVCQINNDGDFKVFLEAASVLKKGETPYHLWFVHHNCLYLYSPFFASLLIPFISLPHVLVNILFLLSTLYFTARCFTLLKKYLPQNFSKRWQNELLLIIPFLFTARFWLYNISLLQMTVFMLWCMLESLDKIEKGKYWSGGFILALGINIKLLPIVILPYLFMRMRWKAFLPIFIFSIFFLIAPGIFFGWNFNLQLLHGWWAEINPTSGSQ